MDWILILIVVYGIPALFGWALCVASARREREAERHQ